MRLRLPAVVRVLRHRRHREAWLLVHQNLQALIERLINHVIHDSRRVPRTGRFAPRAIARRRNPLLAGTKQPIPLDQMQVHLDGFAAGLP